jgi:ATP phosphoribosyltransferase
VEEGYFDIGISGRDWVIESDSDVVEIADMPYSKQGAGNVKIVIAVPQDGDIEEPSGIRPGSRVTTEYPNITGRYFEKLGIDVDIHYSYGATEAKVPDLMDVVVDLTETGSTLRKNGLKIIDVMLESSTKLVANRASWEDPQKRQDIEEIKTLLLSVIEARGKVLLDMNVPAGKLEDIISTLPSLKRPTISRLYGADYYAVETVVSKKDVNILIPKLKGLGAEDILELDISKIVH